MRSFAFLSAVVAAALVLALPVRAADRVLTIEEAISVTTGLGALGRHDAVCKAAGEERPCVKTYDFDADTRWTISTDLTAGKGLMRDFQGACEETAASFGAQPERSGEACGKSIPKEGSRRFDAEVKKLLAQPSNVTFGRLTKGALKLDKNDIPADVLSLLAPIIDP